MASPRNPPDARPRLPNVVETGRIQAPSGVVDDSMAVVKDKHNPCTHKPPDPSLCDGAPNLKAACSQPSIPQANGILRERERERERERIKTFLIVYAPCLYRRAFQIVFGRSFAEPIVIWMI